MKLKVNEPLVSVNSCIVFGFKYMRDCHTEGLLLYHTDMGEERRKDYCFWKKTKGEKGRRK